MAYKIAFTQYAERQFKKLPHEIKQRVRDYILDLIALDNPYDRGHSLTGNWSGFWRYRIGDWRIITKIEKNQLLILVVEIGHRSSVYYS